MDITIGVIESFQELDWEDIFGPMRVVFRVDGFQAFPLFFNTRTPLTLIGWDLTYSTQHISYVSKLPQK